MIKTSAETASHATAPHQREVSHEQDAVPADPGQFEQSLAELERLVDELERGDLGLQESLAVFERGIRLTRGCQQALDEAEQRVRVLLESSTTAEPAAFDQSGLGGRGDDRK